MKTEKPSIRKEEAEKILAEQPFERGFHFFTESGKYTGETAINLFSFYEQLRTIDAQSVKFHLGRKDFQNWITNTLGDAGLSAEIDKINAELPGQELRDAVRKTVMMRIEELQTAANQR